MRLLVHAVIIAVAAGLYVVSSRVEPRRWRNGVLLLVVVWAAVDLVAGEVVDRLGVDHHADSVVLLALPWLGAVVLGILLLLNDFAWCARRAAASATCSPC